MPLEKEVNTTNGMKDHRQKKIRASNGFVQSIELPYNFTAPITARFQYIQGGYWSATTTVSFTSKCWDLLIGCVQISHRHDFDGIQAMEAWNAILRREIHCTISRGGDQNNTKSLKYVLDIGAQVSMITLFFWCTL